MRVSWWERRGLMDGLVVGGVGVGEIRGGGGGVRGEAIG